MKNVCRQSVKLWDKSDDRPAVYDPASRKWWSRGELDHQAEKLAEALPSSKSLVFCFCRNDIASLTWYLACLHSGHAVALIDAGLSTDLQRNLIDHYEPDCIVSSIQLAAATGEHIEFPSGNHLWLKNSAGRKALHSSLTLLLSTSGSTGSPKLVRLTADNLRANASAICAGLGIGEEDCATTSLPLHYSYGLSVVNTHLMAGARLVLTSDGLLTQGFWTLFREHRCTSFAGVPYSYQMLRRLNLDSLDIPALRTLTQAGGKLENGLISEFHSKITRRDGRFFVMYGQTEATARISILPSTALPGKVGSAGLAIDGGRLGIEVDGAMTTRPGVTGELVYTGPNVMMGYANSREELALEDELHGRLYTGDSARFDEDGFVYVIGRMKRDAKLFGLRVNLDEIETMLRVNGPTAVVAAGNGLRILCEYGDNQTFHELRANLAALLRIHSQAFTFERVHQLPLNPNGKIDYQALMRT